MKQVNMRMFTRLRSRDLGEPFEVVVRKKPVGKFMPYGRPLKKMPKFDFTGSFLKIHGKFSRQKDTLPELSEIGALE